MVSVLLLDEEPASGTTASGVDEPEVTFVEPVGAALATGAAEVTGVAVATGATDALDTGATVAKTPPWILVGVATAALDDVALSDEPLPLPDPLEAWQVPAGATGSPEPSNSTDSPGLGNLRSALSIVLQPLPMFAVNISGSAS